MYIYYYKVNISASAVITSERIKTHFKYGHGFFGVSRKKESKCLHALFPRPEDQYNDWALCYHLQPPSVLWAWPALESRAAGVVSVVCFWAFGELLSNRLGVPSGRAGGNLASCCGSLRGSFKYLSGLPC